MANLESNSTSLKKQNQIEVNLWHEEERRELAPIGIGFDGRSYRYGEYRYDLLSDAINYARLDRSKSTCRTQGHGPPQWIMPKLPTAEEQQQMDALGISFDGKYYRYADFRYDQFADAIHYAVLKR
jgi:hypothetical protein